MMDDFPGDIQPFPGDIQTFPAHHSATDTGRDEWALHSDPHTAPLYQGKLFFKIS